VRNKRRKGILRYPKSMSKNKRPATTRSLFWYSSLVRACHCCYCCWMKSRIMAIHGVTTSRNKKENEWHTHTHYYSALLNKNNGLFFFPFFFPIQ
jgi:hypothetical protein